ncbi:MAG: SH3 domain-containing protein [bacterium]|nr:SH3 domain-containing protein [bacterium]
MNKLLLTIFISISSLVYGEGNEKEIFSKSNDFYKLGMYRQAIDGYENLLSQGIKDKAIFYNLGNAYYKDAKIGEARLNYERALRLSPRDEDIRFNLEYVKSIINEEKGGFATQLFAFFTLNELTIITSVFYLLFIISIFPIFFKKRYLILNLSIGIILILLGIWLGLRIYYEEGIKLAIVINPSSQVRNGPSEDYSVGFTLPEGKSVVILSKKGDWVEIGIKEKGLKGWIKKDEIEKI